MKQISHNKNFPREGGMEKIQRKTGNICLAGGATKSNIECRHSVPCFEQTALYSIEMLKTIH